MGWWTIVFTAWVAGALVGGSIVSINLKRQRLVEHCKHYTKSQVKEE